MTPERLAAVRAAIEAVAREGREGGDQAALLQRLQRIIAALDERIAAMVQLREAGQSVAQELRGRERPGVEPVHATPPAARRHDRLGASTFIERGWHLISQGDYPAAVEALRRALDLAPATIEAEALMGWALMLDERLDEAMATFAGVLQRDPGNELARVNIGFICLRKGVFGEAIEHLTRVIREGRDRKATLYAHHYLGLVYLERNMFEDAIPFLARAVELGPNLIEARYELGRALWRAERTEEARAAWQAGVAAGAHSPWAERCREALERHRREEESSPSSSS